MLNRAFTIGVAKIPHCRVCADAYNVAARDRGEKGDHMPKDLKTDQALLQRLEAAAHRHVGREELHRQRVSFIYGNLPKESTITRHQIEERLARIEGATA